MATYDYDVSALTLPPAPASTDDPSVSPQDGLTVPVPSFDTQDELLALMDGLYPEDYMEPLKDPGPGYEMMQAYAKLFERVSFAMGRAECGLYSSLAYGEYASRGTVEFSRPDTSSGDFTVSAGTIVEASATGRQYVLASDVAFSGGALTASGTVVAVQAGFQFDVQGPRTDANGNTLEGEIDTVGLPLLDPPFAERDLGVTQTSDIDDGQPGTLDIIGADRGIRRAANEPDNDYRARVQTLPDTISIDAIRRQLDLLFHHIGFDYTLIETWDNGYQTAFDMDTAYTNLIQGDIDPNLWAYDDERTDPVFFGRWFGADDYVGGLILVVPELPTFEENGFAYDDPAESYASDFETELGSRAVGAYDAVVNLKAYDAAAYDGDDPGKNNFFLEVYNQVQKIKPGGTFFTIELEGQ